LLRQQGVGVAEEQISLSETQLRLANARYEAGTVARLDVLQAQVQLANAKARRIQLVAEVDAAMQAVRTLLSLPQNQVLNLVGNLDEGREIPGREALDLALPSRPDLRAFGARREQAEYASRLANGEWKPGLSFRGNIQFQEDSFSNVLSSQNQNYTFGLAVQMPLLGAPGASARRSVAQAQKRQAEYGLNASTDQARLELETAWTTLQAAAEVVSTQELALELARESVQIAQVSYENGVITSAELNDAQVRMLETEWNLLQAKYGKIIAAARAKVAAGVE
jgi:outer membrane protein TolC